MGKTRRQARSLWKAAQTSDTWRFGAAKMGSRKKRIGGHGGAGDEGLVHPAIDE